MFNTLTFVRRLENAGVSRQQAEAHAEALADLVETDLATKKDLKELEYRLVIRISAIVGAILTFELTAFAGLIKFF